jgi:hypothetical protein
MSSTARVSQAVQFRADAKRLALVPSGLGRDLIELLHGGWMDDCESLWEKYGRLTARVVGFDHNTERRVYAEVADMVIAAMGIARAISHAGTEYRVASAIVGELSGVGTRLCRHCGGSGRRKRSGARCRQCSGAGIVRPSNTMRSTECGCRQPEFVAGLLGVYLTVLAGLQRELARALAQYAAATGPSRGHESTSHEDAHHVCDVARGYSRGFATRRSPASRARRFSTAAIACW